MLHTQPLFKVLELLDVFDKPLIKRDCFRIYLLRPCSQGCTVGHPVQPGAWHVDLEPILRSTGRLNGKTFSRAARLARARKAFHRTEDLKSHAVVKNRTLCLGQEAADWSDRCSLAVFARPNLSPSSVNARVSRLSTPCDETGSHMRSATQCHCSAFSVCCCTVGDSTPFPWPLSMNALMASPTPAGLGTSAHTSGSISKVSRR